VGRLKHTNDKEFHISRYYDSARTRALAKNLPFNITQEYLRSIATDRCPILNIEFTWGRSNLGKGKQYEGTPQLDCIIPEQGYVIGNVAFISGRANRIKDNGTMDEHYAIADWIWEQEHAKQDTITSLSDPNYQDFDNDAELRALFTAGLGEDCNNFDDYCRAICRKDFNHSAKASSGDSVGSGDFEVEPSEASAYIEGIRYSGAKIIRHINRIGYLHRKFRERCLADGKLPKVPEPSNRREQPIQRPKHEEVQSPQEAFKGF
jgi:hypothetical protein